MGSKPASPTRHRALSSHVANNGSTAISTGHDPYTYTAGRWLHQDKLQRQSRFLQFDFPRLCETAMKLCDGASKVTKYEKKEGGYNRVFILTMDTGKRVAARIPTPIAGPPRLTVNSEVATIAYLQSKTSLPIPKILAWNDDSSNPVGIEYIIQDHADGVQLHEQWPLMDSLQHMQCTKDLSLKIEEMASLDFPAYGNIYFADAPIEKRLKIPLEDGFCIGPYCSPLFWNCGVGEAELYNEGNSNRGPWRNLTDYSFGLIDTAFSRIPKQANSNDQLPFRGTIQDHIHLIKSCRETMQVLVGDAHVQAAALPVLIHPDYHKRNIFVSQDDPTKVTALVDWQLASIEPAFMYAQNTPDFASLPEENPAEDEDTGKQLSNDEQQLRNDISICHQTYDVIMRLKIPKMRIAKRLNPTIFRLFHYCFTTWRDGAPAIRQELLDLRSQWTELELPGECPYVPTEEELRQHAAQYEGFETMQKLKAWLQASLQIASDGWVPNEIWDAAKEAYRAAYKEWIETARESEASEGDMTVGKAEKLWPYDAR
ncbi:hypothetical protein EMCG_01599 [[Emmonsia] crescens]|uniref:Altered inheritance of mitochondria protein 9, mitochondrial n=1 Tax=[Emmonsia] crescens TaxID=73230 RepID=A0A0G2I0I3_9EURO|nr:hypothetical protein EMCG_01599 [Emmonsia crescens UAMH 3008]